MSPSAPRTPEAPPSGPAQGPEDTFWTHAGETVGGPMGRHARRRTGALAWFTPARVLLLATAFAAMLAYAIKQPCFSSGWAAPEVYDKVCYSDWPVIFSGRGLAEGVYPYLSAGSKIEYPVLLSLFAAVTAMLVPGSGQSAERYIAYFQINTVLAAAAWMTLAFVTARAAALAHRTGAFRGTGAQNPRWGLGLERGMLVALSPSIIATAYINWDIYTALLCMAAIWACLAKRPVLAGVLIGLGTAFKLFPVMLLGALFLLALRKSLTWKAFALSCVGAAASWLAANVPAILADREAWGYFLKFSREREAGFSSLWFVLERHGVHLAPQTVNQLGLISLLVLLALIVLFGVLSPSRPHLGELAFLIVAAFVLTNKVYSPQFVIWLIPLAALAGISWRMMMAWQVVELLHWWAIWRMLAAWNSEAGSQHVLPESVYTAAVFAHMLALLALMAWVAYRRLNAPAARSGATRPEGRTRTSQHARQPLLP